MKNNAIKTGLVFCLVFLSNYGFSQSFKAEFLVKDQPATQVILGAISGDNFEAIDSTTTTNGKIEFTFPSNAHPGVYRLILGKTTYAQVMDKPAQQFDFIFNNENISISTHFKYPADSIKIIRSEENKLWFSFLNYEEKYRAQYTDLGKDLDALWAVKDTANAFTKSNEFNQLQMARDVHIAQQAQQNPELLAAKMIYQFREPIMDGYLNADEREEVFKKFFFKTVDFSDERLINTPVYTDKVFVYLVSYNDRLFTQSQREVEYIKAVDIVLSNTNKNEKVNRFIIDYLLHGFKVLKLDKVIAHINTNYN